MAAGKFGLAARNLEQVLAWKTDADEAAYVLGICEQARGRNQAADAAWARVAAGSTFTQRAILARLRFYHDTGRLAAAEKMDHRRGQRPAQRRDGPAGAACADLQPDRPVRRCRAAHRGSLGTPICQG